MQAIYFPLRSNGSWFSREGARTMLERRIKHCLVMYDTLYFENARYELLVWEKGNLEFNLPPGTIPGDRTKVAYYSTGDRFAFKVSSDPEGEYHPLLQGPTKEAYVVDFYPILSDADLLQEAYIQPISPEPTTEGKAQEKNEARSWARGFALSIPGSNFQQKALIKGVHYDSAIAAELNLPFTGDPRMAAFVTLKNEQIADQAWDPVLNMTVLRSLVPISFPDFGAMSWETIMDIRESAAGRDLRHLIQRLTTRLPEALEVTDDPQVVDGIVRGLFIEELVEEIRSQAPKVAEVTASFGLNLVPYGGWVGSAAELMNAVEHRQSWVSLLR